MHARMLTKAMHAGESRSARLTEVGRGECLVDDQLGIAPLGAAANMAELMLGSTILPKRVNK